MDVRAHTNSDTPEGNDLSLSFLIQGEMSLLKGDLLAGLNHFDSASKCAPPTAQLFYRQGLSLFEYGSEEGREKALLLANKKFKHALNMDPKFFEGWQAWGNTLCLLGKTYNEHHYFLEAADKYRKAIELATSEDPSTLANIYWDYGIVLGRIAEHSGEADPGRGAPPRCAKSRSGETELSA